MCFIGFRRQPTTGCFYILTQISQFVIPAKAGIHFLATDYTDSKLPAARCDANVSSRRVPRIVAAGLIPLNNQLSIIINQFFVPIRWERAAGFMRFST